MSTPTEKAATEATDTGPGDTPRPNGMTDEQMRYTLAAIGRRKDNPEYLERLLQGAKQARRKINDEYLREMEAEEKK